MGNCIHREIKPIQVVLYNVFASPTSVENTYIISGNDAKNRIYIFEWRMMNKSKNNDVNFVLKPTSTIELTYNELTKTIDNLYYVKPMFVTISEDRQAALLPFKKSTSLRGKSFKQ